MQAQQLHPAVEKLLCEYKEGFNGISELVNGFKDMSDKAQKRHLVYKEIIIEDQLKFVISQEKELAEEIKMFLSRINVQWLQISTMKKSLIEQMNECAVLKDELEKLKEITKEDSKQDVEDHTTEKTK